MDNSLNVPTIILMKLITGETIITKATESPEGYVLDKPLILSPIKNVGNGVQLQFTDFIIGATPKSVFLNNYHILAITFPQENILNDYIKLTTNIQIATSLPKPIRQQ